MPKHINSQLRHLAVAMDLPSARDGGYCHGFTLKWLEACILGQEELKLFLRHVDIILAIEPSVFVTNIEAITGKNGVDLTDLEMALLDIETLMEDLDMYQGPGYFEDLFGARISQHSYAEMSQLAGSNGIKAQGGLITVYSEPCVFQTSEIKAYLDDLKNIMDQQASSNNTVGFVLGNIDHTMGLCYDLTSKNWILMDFNDWPPVPSVRTKIIAQKIMDGFNPDYSAPYITFDISVISTVQNQNSMLSTQLLALRASHLSHLPQDINSRFTEDSLSTISALFGHLDFVKALLAKQGARPTLEEKSLTLFLAIQGGYTPIVNLLLENGVNPNFKRRKDGLTPLSLAVLYQHAEITRVLLIAGALPNLFFEKKSPLYKAVENGDLVITRMLMRQGANPNLINLDNGKTPLSIAKTHGDPEIYDCLSQGERTYNASILLGSLFETNDDAPGPSFADQLQITMDISPDPEGVIFLIDKIKASPYALTIRPAPGFFNQHHLDPAISIAPVAGSGSDFTP